MTNVLLVTVTKVEAQAVLELFPKASGKPWERRYISDKTYYELGQIGGVDVFMVQTEMGISGPGASLITVYKAIEAMKPVAVIMVGIAFGARPDKQRLGDILVSRQIQSYEPQKRKGKQIILRGDRVTASTILLDKFRSGELDWTGAAVYFGLVLSGEKLISGQGFRDDLIKLEPEAIGGEMEGAGLYAAASDTKVDWILIKAICDWADGNKNDDTQTLAAHNSADFVLHVIQQGGLAHWPSKLTREELIDREKQKSLRIYISSPTNMEEEKIRLLSVLEDLKPLCKHIGLDLEILDRHKVMLNTRDSEQLILDQLSPDTWDLFIGILWHCFETTRDVKVPQPQREYRSNMQDEFTIAHNLWQRNKRPHVMFYQCTRDVPLAQLEPIQFERVKAFITDLRANEKYPGLHQTFNNSRDFESRVRIDLIKFFVDYSEKIWGRVVTQQDIQVYVPSSDNLPERKSFFGRDKEIKRMMDALSPHEVGWGVEIDGIGGIGKTSLAIEVAHRCKLLGVFDAYIFISAKQTRLELDEIKDESTFIGTLDDFINLTATVLGRQDFSKLKGESKRHALLSELREMRALLVYDNVETLSENEQQSLIEWLRFLPRDCKAIITSRRRIGGRALCVHLRELDWEAAEAIIQHEADRNTYLKDILKDTNETTLHEIYKETGGSPLALIWVVGMIGSRSSDLDTALSTLRKGLTGETAMKKYIYDAAIKEIGTDGESVLSVLSLFSPMANIESLVVVTNLPRAVVNASLERLIALSLVNESPETECYSLHPLTRAYVRANLLTNTHYLHEVGLRFSRYWVDFATKYGSSSKTYDRIEFEWMNITTAFEWIEVIADIKKNIASNKDAAHMSIELAYGLRQYLLSSKRWKDGLQIDNLASKAAFALDEEFYSVFTIATSDERTDISIIPELSGEPSNEKTKISQRPVAILKSVRGLRTVDLIIDKQDKRELSREAIEFFIKGYTRGDIPDYQATALLMAITLNGMTVRETTDLTLAMAHSGDVLDLSSTVNISVDKHSTGGVGDKTTLVVEPIAAACGLPIGKMSGRGLGFSGGTLDKIESIPGFRTNLSTTEFIEQLRAIGLVLTGQTADLAPVDGKLYALRDVTGTVQSIPLIASSIMSKKIAAGAQAILLDVKVGHGAFIQELSDAKKLAEVMVSIGELAGIKMVALFSDMNQPLGYSIGNSLEVCEAIDTLHNSGPNDFRQLCIEIAAHMLVLGQISPNIDLGRVQAEKAIASGKAFDKFRLLVQTQGGDIAYVDNPRIFPKASFIEIVEAPQCGYLSQVHARIIGEAVVTLGAGRMRKGSSIDHAVGLIIRHKVGDKVGKGEPLFEIHANNQEQGAQVKDMVLSAHTFSEDPVEPLPLIYGELSGTLSR